MQSKIGPAYMRPAVARALLDLSRARRAHRMAIRAYYGDPGTRTYDDLKEAAREYGGAMIALAQASGKPMTGLARDAGMIRTAQ